MEWMEPIWDQVNIECDYCKGKGTDPKKRKRLCPECHGTKVEVVCATCLKKKCECIPCHRCEEDPCVCDSVFF